MATENSEELVRIEIEITVSVTDANALRAAAIKKIEEEGTWEDGSDATAEQRTSEVEEIKSDIARAVHTLLDSNGVVDDIPGIEERQASFGAKLASSTDFW